MNLQIKIKKVHPKAQVPTKATPFSNCFDLRAVFDGEPVVIPPGGQAKFDTGLIFEYEKGWSMDVYSRSGMGFMKQIRLSNGTGIIDEDFRNTVKIALHNDSAEPFTVASGDRIAQARLVETHQYEFEVVDDVSQTVRGAGGIGSTGTN
jgi:dUTP pyrophosphatase